MRNLKSHAISVLGMSMAFTVTVLISVYVYKQLIIDKSQSNYDSIYRLELGTWAHLPGGIIPWLAEQFPEVEAYARIGPAYRESMFEYGKKYHSIQDVLFMDGDPFNVFDFDIVYGNPAKVLEAPNAVILTRSVSERIFADKNPVGELINYNRDYPLLVSAVIEDPDNMHLNFDAIIQFQQIIDVWLGGNKRFLTELRGSQNFMGYFVLNTDNPDALVDKMISSLIEINVYSEAPSYSLRPYSDIYFLDEDINEHGIIHGNRQTVIALIFVAIFVLLIATINYVNVSTAEGISRAREVGLKKILGSGRKTLITQFIIESLVINFISLIVALLLILNFYQLFQTALGVDLPSLKELPLLIYFIVFGVFLFASFAGGLYPAFYLSSVQPKNLFNINLKSGLRGRITRRVLILVQFTIAIFLSIQSLTVFKQYIYMKNSDPGMDIEQIINFELPDHLVARSYMIRDELLEHPDISAVSFTSQPVGNIRNTNTLTSPFTEQQVAFKMQFTDPEYFDVLGLEMVGGRHFERSKQADRGRAWVINETGAIAMGCDPPESIIGFKWMDRQTEYSIIGLVRDYHFNSLQKSIEPSFLIWREGFKMAHLKFSSSDIPAVLDHIENVWKTFEPDKPINYSFLDETFDKDYVAEQRLGRLIGSFTIITLIIACFGVFGMSAFMARQMAKSITLRKVMGADTVTVVEHFTREYFWILIIAAAISVPLGYLYTNQWLSRFPYQTDISAWIFIGAFILNLFITITTIAYHAFRTANLNPVDVLRYE